MSASRLRIDLKRLTKEAREGISAAPRENNILVWDAIVLGPPDTPWDGGIFKLTLKFSQDYPCTPPIVRFVSKMFHPNVDHHGFIFLDILKDQWNPFYDVAAILTSIQVLLNDPNPDLAVHEEAADLYCKDRKEYNRRVRNVVERSP